MKKKFFGMMIVVIVLFSIQFQTHASTKCIDGEDHSWGDWKLVEKATLYHDGKEERECSYCQTKEYRSVPKQKSTAGSRQALAIVNQYFKYAKTYNVKKMKKCFTKKPKNFFFENKRFFMVKRVKKYNKKMMSWSVLDAIQTKSIIYVKIKVTYPNGYMAAYKTGDKLVEYCFLHPNASNKKILKKVKQYLSKYYKKYGIKKETQTIIISLKNVNGKWKMLKSDDLQNVTNMRYEEGTQDGIALWDDDDDDDEEDDEEDPFEVYETYDY